MERRNRRLSGLLSTTSSSLMLTVSRCSIELWVLWFLILEEPTIYSYTLGQNLISMVTVLYSGVVVSVLDYHVQTTVKTYVFSDHLI